MVSKIVLLRILCNNRVSSYYLFYSKFWGVQKGSKIRIGCPKDRWMGIWLKPWMKQNEREILHSLRKNF